MKQNLFAILALLIVVSSYAQNTFPGTGAAGIGTAAPDASSLLEVKSTTKGILIPRMTQAKRDAIAGPATGLLIYQTNATPGFYYYSGAAWKALAPAGVNKTLSNLTSSTAINTSLLPGTNGNLDLGSSNFNWRNAYLTGNLTATSVSASNSGGSTGVYGSGTSYGVSGYSDNYGVYGSGTYGVAGIGTSYGLYGYSTNGYGVYGNSGNLGVYGAGTGSGVYGYSNTGSGVYGYGTTYGVYGYSNGISSYGVYGSSVTEGSYGVYANSAAGDGLYATTGNNASYWAGFFVGDVYSSTGVYASSDARVKQNIRDFTSAMDVINKLHPKQYEFRSDGDYKLLNFPGGTHFGLIAQDVEKVLPNLVKTSQLVTPVTKTPDSANANIKPKMEISDFKALNYTELIPVIIKAMQELEAQNTDLKNKVSDLETLLNQYIKPSGTVSLSSATLSQNFPNPFSKSTTINFSIPKESNAASIVVSQTGSGKIIKTITITPNDTQLTFDAASLSAGSYIYTLYIDGKKIDTKQMLIGR